MAEVERQLLREINSPHVYSEGIIYDAVEFVTAGVPINLPRHQYMLINRDKTYYIRGLNVSTGNGKILIQTGRIEAVASMIALSADMSQPVLEGDVLIVT